MKSLAELKSSPDVGLPETKAKICLSAKLLAEQEAANEAMIEAQLAYERARETAQARRDGEAAPRRAGEGVSLAALDKAAKKATATAEDVHKRMEEASVEVLLRCKDDGVWRQWQTEHPARDEETDPVGADRDQKWGLSLCNIDALADDLRLWAASYNGEPASDEWAEFIAANGVRAQIRMAASKIVAMQEQVVDAGKSPTAWREDRMSALDSK